MTDLRQEQNRFYCRTVQLPYASGGFLGKTTCGLSFCNVCCSLMYSPLPDWSELRAYLPGDQVVLETKTTSALLSCGKAVCLQYVNAVNHDPYDIWTSLKMVLTPLKR